MQAPVVLPGQALLAAKLLTAVNSCWVRSSREAFQARLSSYTVGHSSKPLRKGLYKIIQEIDSLPHGRATLVSVKIRLHIRWLAAWHPAQTEDAIAIVSMNSTDYWITNELFPLWLLT